MTSIDETTGLTQQIKRPDEELLVNFDFSVLLNTDTIVNVTSVTQTSRGLVPGSIDVTLGTPSHDSAQDGQIRISDGTSGEKYCLDMLVLTTNGDSRQCSGVIYVIDSCGE